MNACESWVLTRPKSPVCVKIFCMFDENPVGNLIFWMTYFISFLCCFVNNHGRIIFQSPSTPLEIITLCNAWLDYAMSLKNFQFYLCQSFHLIFSISFMLHSSRYALYRTNELFVGARSKETYWIVWDNS